MGDQGLMQLAAEQGDAVGAGVVAEEMAGHAELVSAAAAAPVRPCRSLGWVFSPPPGAGEEPMNCAGDWWKGHDNRTPSHLQFKAKVPGVEIGRISHVGC
jgi:hypothetical protein